MTTRITEFCDGVLALDGKATAGPWVIEPDASGTYGAISAPESNPPWFSLGRFVIKMRSGAEVPHNINLTCAYRSSAPALARALKTAVEALGMLSTFPPAAEALAEIAELIPKE